MFDMPSVIDWNIVCNFLMTLAHGHSRQVKTDKKLTKEQKKEDKRQNKKEKLEEVRVIQHFILFD